MKRKSPDSEITKRSRDRIKSLVKECGRQSDFVEKTGIPKGNVSRYVNGGNIPSDEYAQKIADTFGVSVLWVKGYDVDRNAPNSLRSLRTLGEAKDALKKDNDMVFENVLDAVNCRLESTAYKGVYILTRFPDGTINSADDITISHDELQKFNDDIIRYASFLVGEIFSSNAKKESNSKLG